MGEHGGRCRVGQVVGGDVDGLHTGDRPLPGRGDALLQLSHLRLEGRLVTDLGGHPAEQGRHFGAGLDEPEDVVDEEQHVLAFTIAEVLRHGQAGQGYPHAGPGRLVHLAEHQDGLVEHPGFLHLQIEVVTLTRTLAHPAERRQAAVLLSEIVNQLLDDHGLAHPGPAEQAHLAALGVRGQQIDDFDPGLEHLRGRGHGLDLRGIPMDGPALHIARQRGAEIDRLAQQIEDPAERVPTDRHGDGATGVDHFGPPGEPVGDVHDHGPDPVVTEVLLHLAHQVLVLLGGDVESLFLRRRGGPADPEGMIDLGQLVREHRLDHDALDLLDPAHVLSAILRARRRLFRFRQCHNILQFSATPVTRPGRPPAFL